jgi:hypothetical protein
LKPGTTDQENFSTGNISANVCSTGFIKQFSEVLKKDFKLVGFNDLVPNIFLESIVKKQQ